MCWILLVTIKGLCRGIWWEYCVRQRIVLLLKYLNPAKTQFSVSLVKKKKYRAISFVGGIKPSKPTSFDIRASMLKSSLVLTEDNFMERNCKREHALRNHLPQNHWLWLFLITQNVKFVPQLGAVMTARNLWSRRAWVLFRSPCCNRVQDLVEASSFRWSSLFEPIEEFS